MQFMSKEKEKLMLTLENDVKNFLANHSLIESIIINENRQIYIKSKDGNILYFGKLNVKKNPNEYYELF